MPEDRTPAALEAMAREDPELAARLALMSLPAAAARVRDTLAYELDVDGLGRWRVSIADGRARVEPVSGSELDGSVDFRLAADAAALAALAAGASPLRLALSGRLRIRGKRRKALKLRAMGSGPPPDAAQVVDAGGELDPELLYRSLPYLVDPDWTRGHRFAVRYEIDGAGSWWVEARDGEPLRVTSAGDGADATARLSFDTWRRIATRELSPTIAMQNRLTIVDGQVAPVTLLGRWIDRAQGRDDAELRREEDQRRRQEERAGAFSVDGGRELLDYRQLYGLWERQNWKASELDFSVDREHWLTTPSEGQEGIIWSLGSFYVGEERVTADLAPFLLAAPSGEIEVFLATQLVDEARHAAFFDRFGAEVMALSADDLRGRMSEVGRTLLGPWRDVFDNGLRDVANRIKSRPDDLDLFVEGITTYHMVVEGFLAVTGQTLIRDYMAEHGLYPGFCEGFGLVERDEHRHVAFGVRFLKDAIDEDPRHRETVERTVLELVPRAAYVFVPPYADDPSDWVSYGYTSAQTYGLAYRTLKRRMKVLGIELPPPEDLLPGPVDV